MHAVRPKFDIWSEPPLFAPARAMADGGEADSEQEAQPAVFRDDILPISGGFLKKKNVWLAHQKVVESEIGEQVHFFEIRVAEAKCKEFLGKGKLVVAQLLRQRNNAVEKAIGDLPMEAAEDPLADKKPDKRVGNKKTFEGEIPNILSITLPLQSGLQHECRVLSATDGRSSLWLEARQANLDLLVRHDLLLPVHQMVQPEYDKPYVHHWQTPKGTVMYCDWYDSSDQRWKVHKRKINPDITDEEAFGHECKKTARMVQTFRDEYHEEPIDE